MSYLMHRPLSLLRYYHALECASHEMLQAARQSDWDSVCRLEGACSVVIAKLRQMAELCPLTNEEQPERMRILQSIVRNDAEIRHLALRHGYDLDASAEFASEGSGMRALH